MSFKFALKSKVDEEIIEIQVKVSKPPSLRVSFEKLQPFKIFSLILRVDEGILYGSLRKSDEN